MNELALFAGAGGGILGGILSGFTTVCAVEKEPYCREVLLRRQRDGVLPLFPIWDDVRTFDGRAWRGIVDVVTAGFPCQPFSAAGKRLGADDERNMWPDTIRVLREVGPAFALLENVPHLLAHDYFGEVLGDLAEAGFDAEWGIVSAAECGAPHLRERVWIVAYATSGGAAADGQPWKRHGTQQVGKDGEADAGDNGAASDAKSRESRQPPERQRGEDSRRGSQEIYVANASSRGGREGQQDHGCVGVAHADGSGESLAETAEQGFADAQGGDALGQLGGRRAAGGCRWWDAEPDVGGTTDGLASRMDEP